MLRAARNGDEGQNRDKGHNRDECHNHDEGHNQPILKILKYSNIKYADFGSARYTSYISIENDKKVQFWTLYEGIKIRFYVSTLFMINDRFGTFDAVYVGHNRQTAPLLLLPNL